MHKVYGTLELFSQTSCTLYKWPCELWQPQSVPCCFQVSCTPPSCHIRDAAMSQPLEVQEKILSPARQARRRREEMRSPAMGSITAETPRGRAGAGCTHRVGLPRHKHPWAHRRALQWSSSPTASRDCVRCLLCLLLANTGEKQRFLFFFGSHQCAGASV